MPSVLIIDDDQAIRGLLETLLTIEGYDVHAAADGLAGLSAVEELEPDCVLLDLMMPGLDGHAVLQAIRARPHGMDVPVVMLTAASDDDNAWQAWQGGVDYFLPKPFEVQHLLAYLSWLFTTAPAA